MEGEKVLIVVKKAIRQASMGDYILGEVEAYIENNGHIDREFRNWFIRHMVKYKKG